MASLQNDFLDFLRLFAQPQIGKCSPSALETLYRFLSWIKDVAINIC